MLRMWCLAMIASNSRRRSSGSHSGLTSPRSSRLSLSARSLAIAASILSVINGIVGILEGSLHSLTVLPTAISSATCGYFDSSSK